MLNTHTVSRQKMGFDLHPLNPKKEPHPIFFLGQRGSFWIATLSVMAFLVGNMMGQHGWHLFWASVLGRSDDSLIVYTGTVAPVAQVPNYGDWSGYGGNSDSHTYRQVPDSIFIDLPKYSAIDMHSVYSVAWKGSYTSDSENTGSHPGVDIRVPEGTPVVSIANGIVDTVKSGGGFGNVVVIRHPNVPNPDNPGRKTTLYSVYAHLQTPMATVGAIVTKGEQIGTSGSTGFASGPHLHFQIDRESAPWHPYWPFSSTEARNAGLSTADAVNQGLHKHRLSNYTISPMLYVQEHSAVVRRTSRLASTREVPTVPYVRPRVVQEPVVRAAAPVIFNSSSSSVRSISSLSTSSRISGSIRKSLAQQIRDRRSERIASRLQTRRFTSTIRSRRVATPVIQAAQPIVQTHTVASLSPDSGFIGITPVDHIEIEHDGSFSRGWETIYIVLKDKDGNTVTNPDIKDVHLRTEIGNAKFTPSVVTLVDFVQGRARVNMRPRGRSTIIVKAQPSGDMSSPISYTRAR